MWMTRSQGSGPTAAESPGLAQRDRIDELRVAYEGRRREIEARLATFQSIWDRGSDNELFAEMTFCLCAVQTAARRCDSAVHHLRERGLLLAGSSQEVAEILVAHGVRFHWTKGERIVRARRQFFDPFPSLRWSLAARTDDVPGLRNWLQAQVLGLGWKEASHFLRNIGHGAQLAILDRHILRNLQRLGIIDQVPGSLSRARYLEIEERMRHFCMGVGIPLNHLDLLLWARETGFIFK